MNRRPMKQTASREDLQSRDLEDEKDQHGANAAAGGFRL